MWISLSIGTGSGRAVSPALSRAERLGKPDHPILAYAASGAPFLLYAARVGDGSLPSRMRNGIRPAYFEIGSLRDLTNFVDQPEPYAKWRPDSSGATYRELARSIGKRKVMDYATSKRTWAKRFGSPTAEAKGLPVEFRKQGVRC